MEKNVRNTLRKIVIKCRKLLERSIGELLEGRYGVHSDGMMEDGEGLVHLLDDERGYRENIKVHIDHIRAGGFGAADAVEQLVREISFTHLNRLCAYKIMETRKFILETMGRGLNSKGYKFYLADHPDEERLWKAGKQYEAYVHYLADVGARLSEEIRVLFSPNDLANHIFPPQKVLEEVLELINNDQLRDIWDSDETIGWIYQYFTPKELRDKARKANPAPQNSYELAFLNQFYTPRYVVEFLTDNTLGRTWYEMRKGETALRERCEYMVIRPNEIFLVEGEESPMEDEEDKTKEELSQEELLKKEVYIPHRVKKDPRELKILDPACGSGHFLLYCFDLLLSIYEEAYFDRDLGPGLKRDFPTLADLKKAVPGLIMGRNLHGIDIDLRATQMTALALWLRAQRAYWESGIKDGNKPRITRANIVCAEPMPGEKRMLEEFTSRIKPKIIGKMVVHIFEKMKLAGEAGSLLKIEEEIKEAVVDAKERWLANPKTRQQTLFGGFVQGTEQAVLDFAGITDADFWEEAEARVLEGLQEYAEMASGGKGLAKKLFSDDAAQGFAFIDICRKRYDIVLMNPPFGHASKPSKEYIEMSYTRTKNDVYAAFVERGINQLFSRGKLGAITSRTGFFLKSFQKWREEILLQEVVPTVVADLGFGVLDTAMVETAAYCLEAK